MAKVLRNGRWVEIATGAAARKAAVEQRKQDEEYWRQQQENDLIIAAEFATWLHERKLLKSCDSIIKNALNGTLEVKIEKKGN